MLTFFVLFDSFLVLHTAVYLSTMDAIRLPLSNCPKAKFGLSLFSNNKMVSFCKHEPQRISNDGRLQNRQPPASQTANQHAMLELEWQSNLTKNRITRSLVAESCAIFKSVQRLCHNQEPLEKADMVRYSRLYRCLLQSTLSKLKQARSNCSNDEEDDAEERADLDSYIEMVHKLSVVWHLCELIFIDVHQTGMFLNQLLAWIRWHFNDIAQEVKTLMDSSPDVHTDPKYWDIVYKFVLRGEVQAAEHFLCLHPDKASQDFVVIRDLLDKMPLFTNSTSLFEFSNSWQLWSLECKQVYDHYTFTRESRLRPLAGLLAGDLHELIGHKHLVENWFHLMVAMLLYSDPAVKESEYTLLTHESMKYYYPKASDRTNFDRILVSAFTYDLMETFKLCFEEFSDDWWFVTHFADLLFNGGQLQEYQVVEANKFRHSLLTEYAGSLMSHRSLWTIGSWYYESCEDQGRQYLNLFLERIPVRDPFCVKKVLVIAERLQLKQLQLTVCEIVARQHFKAGRLSESLIWAIRSEEEMLITDLCDRFLKHYAKNGTFMDEDLLGSLGSLMLVSDRLTFLAKYYEFHQLLKLSHHQEACELLISLLASGIVPNFFRPVLVFDAIPLLQSRNCNFKPSQINNIFQALEELANRSTLDSKFDQQSETSFYDIDLFKEKEMLLRISIAQKMAEAV